MSTNELIDQQSADLYDALRHGESLERHLRRGPLSLRMALSTRLIAAIAAGLIPVAITLTLWLSDDRPVGPSEAYVTAARDLEPGDVIRRADLSVHLLSDAQRKAGNADALVEGLVGRVLEEPVEEGDVVGPSPETRAVSALHERVVRVAVDARRVPRVLRVGDGVVLFAPARTPGAAAVEIGEGEVRALPADEHDGTAVLEVAVDADLAATLASNDEALVVAAVSDE